MPLPAPFDPLPLIAALQVELSQDLEHCEIPQVINAVLTKRRGNSSSDPGLLYLPRCCERLAQLGSLYVAAKNFSEARVCFARVAGMWMEAVSNFPFGFRDQIKVRLHSSHRKKYEADPNYTVVEFSKSTERGYYDVTLSYCRQPHPEITLLALLSALAIRDFDKALRIARGYKVYLPSSTPNLLGVVISLLRGNDHLVQPYFATPKAIGKLSLQFPIRPREFAHGIVENSEPAILAGCTAVNRAYDKTWAKTGAQDSKMIRYLTEWGWLFSLYAVGMLNLAVSKGMCIRDTKFFSEWIPSQMVLGYHS